MLEEYSYGLLRKLDKHHRVVSETTPEQEQQIEKRQPAWFTCFLCENRIARTEARVQIEGMSEHMHVNPHGIVFHVLCVAEAPGCAGAGEWLSYWSWFRGYSWQILLCRVCGNHLGWLFRSDSHEFAGLIKDRLVEKD
jgi:hypothetical protein